VLGQPGNAVQQVGERDRGDERLPPEPLRRPAEPYSSPGEIDLLQRCRQPDFKTIAAAAGGQHCLGQDADAAPGRVKEASVISDPILPDPERPADHLRRARHRKVILQPFHAELIQGNSPELLRVVGNEEMLRHTPPEPFDDKVLELHF
jgi:hypothetical protein